MFAEFNLPSPKQSGMDNIFEFHQTQTPNIMPIGSSYRKPPPGLTKAPENQVFRQQQQQQQHFQGNNNFKDNGSVFQSDTFEQNPLKTDENSSNMFVSDSFQTKEARYTSLGSKISDTSISSEENLTDDSRSNHAISPTPNNSSQNMLESGMPASYKHEIMAVCNFLAQFLYGKVPRLRVRKWMNECIFLIQEHQDQIFMNFKNSKDWNNKAQQLAQQSTIYKLALILNGADSSSFFLKASEKAYIDFYNEIVPNVPTNVEFRVQPGNVMIVDNFDQNKRQDVYSGPAQAKNFRTSLSASPDLGVSCLAVEESRVFKNDTGQKMMTVADFMQTKFGSVKQKTESTNTGGLTGLNGRVSRRRNGNVVPGNSGNFQNFRNQSSSGESSSNEAGWTNGQIDARNSEFKHMDARSRQSGTQNGIQNSAQSATQVSYQASKPQNVPQNRSFTPQKHFKNQNFGQKQNFPRHFNQNRNYNYQNQNFNQNCSQNSNQTQNFNNQAPSFNEPQNFNQSIAQTLASELNPDQLKALSQVQRVQDLENLFKPNNEFKSTNDNSPSNGNNFEQWPDANSRNERVVAPIGPPKSNAMDPRLDIFATDLFDTERQNCGSAETVRGTFSTRNSSDSKLGTDFSKLSIDQVNSIWN